MKNKELKARNKPDNTNNWQTLDTCERWLRINDIPQFKLPC